MLLRIWWPPWVPLKPGFVQIPAPRPVNGGAEGLLTTPWIVKPLMTTLSPSIWKAPSESSCGCVPSWATTRTFALSLAAEGVNVKLPRPSRSIGWLAAIVAQMEPPSRDVPSKKFCFPMNPATNADLG